MVKELPVVYLQLAACSGCAVSTINSASPTIKSVHINLKFHPVIMGSSGDMAIGVLEKTQKEHKDGYVLVVDGAVPMAKDAIYGTVGERGGKPPNNLHPFTKNT